MVLSATVERVARVLHAIIIYMSVILFNVTVLDGE
jgi:hypothetical protein